MLPSDWDKDDDDEEEDEKDYVDVYSPTKETCPMSMPKALYVKRQREWYPPTVWREIMPTRNSMQFHAKG